MRVTAYPSPNFGPRRGGALPDLVVLHYTAMARTQAALERLCDPLAEVSAHYLISRRGEVFSMVSETSRAWHAGGGGWGNVTDVNSRSIGIELSNSGDEPFGAGQMAALAMLLGAIMVRHAIPPERVIGHSDMAPERKADPGAMFDWHGLAGQGLSVWPVVGAAGGGDRVAGGYGGHRDGDDGGSGCADAGDFLSDARRFGYCPPEGPSGAQAILTAFRLRFRPDASGPEDHLDRALIRDLANRYPVDRKPLNA